MVWTGKLASLRRFKDDVSEVKVGMECGLSLERFNDVKVGDIIELFTVERIAQTVTRPAQIRMTVALLSLECYLPMSQSLKDKRMVVRRIKDRLRALNVAVAEVAHQDLWQRAGWAWSPWRRMIRAPGRS